MPAKPYESFRSRMGDTKCHRLFLTSIPFDNAWLKGKDRSTLKKWLLVTYQKDYDKFVMTWNYDYSAKKVQWLDPSTHALVKGNITGYDNNWTRDKKNSQKVIRSRFELNQATFEYQDFDDDNSADDAYVTSCQGDGATSVVTLRSIGPSAYMNRSLAGDD